MIVNRTTHLLLRFCETQMYVDGNLAGSHSFVEATRNRDVVIQVMNSAGFSLRKWTPNDRSLIEDLPPIIYWIPNVVGMRAMTHFSSSQLQRPISL